MIDAVGYRVPPRVLPGLQFCVTTSPLASVTTRAAPALSATAKAGSRFARSQPCIWLYTTPAAAAVCEATSCRSPFRSRLNSTPKPMTPTKAKTATEAAATTMNARSNRPPSGPRPKRLLIRQIPQPIAHTHDCLDNVVAGISQFVPQVLHVRVDAALVAGEFITVDAVG